MKPSGAHGDDARRAWRRLREVLEGAEHWADRSDRSALQLLADVGVLRRALDRAELSVVRLARRHGRSWTEIATELGVSRQSAWERWRDVDQPEESESGRVLDAVVDDLVAGAEAEPATQPERRRSPGTGTIPDVIGLSVGDARSALLAAAFRPVAHNPGGAPTPLTASASGVVTDQVPRGGSRRRAGSAVTLWLTGGGGPTPVREPRRPRPTPSAARAEQDPVES